MADNWWQNDPVVTPAAPSSGEGAWWQNDPVVKPAEPSVAADVAKSGGTGIVKGIEALAGLPADVQKHLNNLIGSGVLYVGSKLGLPEPPADTTKPLAERVMPTSENIGKVVESVTGPLHEPETTAGKYAETVGEFIPGAVTMGPARAAGNVLKDAAGNIIKYAVAPGVASEAAGNRFEGTWAEPIARIGGALLGGVGAGGASKVGEALANRSAASTAAQEAGNVSPGAVARVAKSYEADQLTPAAVAQRQAELGPEAMMLDMGRQLQGRAEAIASQPGRGQNTVLNAVEGRTGTFGSGTADRIRDTLDQTMGPSPDIVAERNHINAVTDSVARPIYDHVMSAHPVVDVPAGITSRPAIAQAMKDAVSLARNHGEQLVSPTETQTILKGPGYHIAEDVAAPAKTSLAYWDYVKKALDSRIGGMMRSGGVQDLNSQDKADLAGLLSAKNALVNHLDNVTAGSYALARKTAATKFEVNDAIDLGRSSLNTKLLPEELAEQMQGMSLPEQEGVKLGMRREVDRIIDTARNDGAAARRVLDTNQNREKIANVFGQDAADAIDRRIAAETQFQNATHNISSNSRTAIRSQLVKDTESPSAAAPPTANLMGYVHKYGLSGLDYLRQEGMARTREGIGDLMTRQGSEIPRLADVLSRYNAARTANAGPSLPAQAGSLASVIASQVPGWYSGFLTGNRREQQPNQ